MNYSSRTIMNVARRLRPLYVRTAFDAAGGTAEYDHGVYAVGEPYGSLPTAVKPEWNFVRWVFADGSSAFPTTPARDGDLTALWSQLPTDERLWFLAKEDSTIAIERNGGPALTLETSLNGGGWTAWDGSVLTLQTGDYVVVRAGPEGNPNGTATGTSAYNRFLLTGKVEARGDIMSLFDADGETRTLKGYCFANLFSGQTALVSAPLFDFDTISGFYPTASMFSRTAVTRVVLGRGAQQRLADYNWLNGAPEYGQLVQPSAAETNSNAQRGNGNTPSRWAVLNYGASEGDPYIVDNTNKTDGLMDGLITNSLPDDLDYVIRIPHNLFAQYEADTSWGAFAGRFVADAERSWDVADAQIGMNGAIPVGSSIVPVVRDSFGYAMTEGTDYVMTVTGSTSQTGEVVVSFEGRGSYTGGVQKTVQVVEPQNITKITYSDGKPDLYVSKETLTWQDVGKTTDAYQNVYMNSVQFGRNVKEIANEAFYGQISGLEGKPLVIPSNVKNIGRYAFYNTWISNIDLTDYRDPSDVLHIHNEAFMPNQTHNVKAYDQEMVDAFKTAGWDQTYFVFTTLN